MLKCSLSKMFQCWCDCSPLRNGRQSYNITLRKQEETHSSRNKSPGGLTSRCLSLPVKVDRKTDTKQMRMCDETV